MSLSSLAHRAARPSLLGNPVLRLPYTALTTTRHASLSAINKGLVRSEQARPQGPRPEKLSELAAGTKRMTYAERQEARKRLAEERPAFKIRKGKKDITEYPDQAKPKSRQARFYDPESPFGKKSLVYQMKTGKLRDELRALEEKETDGGGSSDSPFETSVPRPDLRSPPRRSAMERRSVRDDDTGDVADFVAELTRSAGPNRDAPRGDVARRREAPAGAEDGDSLGRGGSSSSSSSSRRDRGAGRREDAPRHKKEEDRDPPTITYTTAASQFLYGRSVVEAALRCSRRQLYKLYIYGGANRRTRGDDSLIRTLAERRGVPVTVLGDERGLRLLNRMSSSRPHNGFVLEASPLPQPPVTALGPLPDDYAGNPRYGVELGHQSAEEVAVNGRPASLPAPTASHRPLVLVVDRVVDPGNLGAILRTASFLGAAAVGITRRGSAGLTPVALKASAGAAESLPLFSVGSLPEFLSLSRANGWEVYAAVAGAPARKQRRHVDLRDVQEADPLRRDPCVLLVGNEGEGLDRMVVKKADYEVNIPNMSAPDSGVDSLNVSVAVGLLCSAFLRGAAKEMEGLGIGLGQGEEKGAKEDLW
ncbi:hypothetical protein L209DRAFT_747100 [Thermothelomyces heterothallicus CBS 203.75]